MTPDDTLLAEIVELARRHTGARTVTAGTRLYADLGMTGDDASEFVRTFTAKYDVDLSGLVWQRHFDDESSMADMLEPAMVLAASVLSPAFAVRWQAARDAEREITIAHLADVARARVWRDPDESYRRERKSPLLGVIFSAITSLAMTFFVLLGGGVIYASLAGKLGDRNLVALVGVTAMALLPIYFAYASWRQILHKLDSAPSD